MEVERVEKKKKVARRKNHVNNPKDTQIATLSEKYEVVKAEHPQIIPYIEEEDVHAVIDKYSANLDVDLYTIADTFHISTVTLSNLLKSEKYHSEYVAAKAKRGELLAQKGLQVAFTPYNKLMAGEEIPRELVKAAALASNYSLNLARALNPELNPSKIGEIGSQNIAVVVNTSVDLNV